MNTSFDTLDASRPGFAAIQAAVDRWSAAPLDAAKAGADGFVTRTPPLGTANTVEARQQWAQAQARLIQASQHLLQVPDGSALAAMFRDVAMFTPGDPAMGVLVHIARANVAASVAGADPVQVPAMLAGIPPTRNDDYPGLWFTPRLDPRQADTVLDTARQTLAAVASACNRGGASPTQLDQVSTAVGRLQLAYDHMVHTNTIYDFTASLPELDFPTPAQWRLQASNRESALSPAERGSQLNVAAEPGLTPTVIAAQATAQAVVGYSAPSLSSAVSTPVVRPPVAQAVSVHM